MFSKKNKPIFILSILILLFTFSSCDNDDNDELVVQQLVIVDKAVASSDLSDSQVTPMLNDVDVVVDLSNGVKLLTLAEQMVSVTSPDISASNGVIHIIDEVMLPITKGKDIIETVMASDDLSILVSAILIIIKIKNIKRRKH